MQLIAMSLAMPALVKAADAPATPARALPWLSGSLALWLSGSLALWLSGSLALWLSGSLALKGRLSSLFSSLPFKKGVHSRFRGLGRSPAVFFYPVFSMS